MHQDLISEDIKKVLRDFLIKLSKDHEMKVVMVYFIGSACQVGHVISWQMPVTSQYGDINSRLSFMFSTHISPFGKIKKLGQ